ncbi:M15 family metallopeptidase [Peribacillus simplex]|uniref:M15 family metallopeptidase n=1 Tax=Peribacillus simplex TaxID=1478 RepID=UPI00203F5F1E|nr:M15 family metallopeptidase [Peribacillus simplex]MCM3673038.1 M15 family metallopeptidase [Peribacillus simplex]
MTVALQTLLEKSMKNMGNGIHPVVKESALEMIKRAYKEGIIVQISAGYRSMEEQAALYGQSRLYSYNGKDYSNLAKPNVTNAKPGQSFHNFGLAIDYFLVTDDGKTALWTVKTKWKRVAAIGKDLGFKWGGDWTGFKDYPHLEMTGGLSYSQLQAGKIPSLTLKFKTDSETVVTVPKTEVASDVSKQPSKNKGDATIVSIQKTLNSRYKSGLIVDGFNGPKTKSALIKALHKELNKQFNKKLVVDGKWGTKTKAAVVTVQKAILLGFYRLHFT